jgi:hypothetical protein
MMMFIRILDAQISMFGFAIHLPKPKNQGAGCCRAQDSQRQRALVVFIALGTSDLLGGSSHGSPLVKKTRVKKCPIP